MENNHRPAQCKRALDYMKVHGSLTSIEALQELGIMSFPKRICELKNAGCVFKTKTENGIDRYGGKFRVKRYYLVD